MSKINYEIIELNSKKEMDLFGRMYFISSKELLPDIMKIYTTSRADRILTKDHRIGYGFIVNEAGSCIRGFCFLDPNNPSHSFDWLYSFRDRNNFKKPLKVAPCHNNYTPLVQCFINEHGQFDLKFKKRHDEDLFVGFHTIVVYVFPENSVIKEWFEHYNQTRFQWLLD